MLILNINGCKYNFRSKQSEITLSIGQSLDELRKEYPCDCNPKYQQLALTLLCDCPLEVAELVAEDQLARLIGTHPFFRNDIYVQHEEIIKYQGQLYRYANLTKPMTVEQYGQWDFYAINEMHDELVLALYLPIKMTIKNRFKYRRIKNIESIDYMNYFQYKLSLFLYFRQKQEVLKTYGLSIDDDGIPAEDKPDEYVLTELERYGIYHLVMEICDDDYDKYNAWLSRDIEELFKYIKYVGKKTLIKNLSQKSV